MGLDMYLTGHKYFHSRTGKRGERKGEDYDLGYWRKHPDLHGYIVQEFADGIDDCREVPMCAGRLRQVIAAIRDRRLPETAGFFFGKSDGGDEQAARDIEAIEAALAWLETDEPGVWRSVSYQASW